MLNVLCQDGSRYLLDTLALSWTLLDKNGEVSERGTYIERTDPILPGEGFEMLCETARGKDQASKMAGTPMVLSVHVMLDFYWDTSSIQ